MVGVCCGIGALVCDGWGVILHSKHSHGVQDGAPALWLGVLQVRQGEAWDATHGVALMLPSHRGVAQVDLLVDHIKLHPWEPGRNHLKQHWLRGFSQFHLVTGDIYRTWVWVFGKETDISLAYEGWVYIVNLSAARWMALAAIIMGHNYTSITGLISWGSKIILSIFTHFLTCL